MRCKVLAPLLHRGRTYMPGHEADLPEVTAEGLAKAGVVELPEKAAKKPKQPQKRAKAVGNQQD